MCSVYDNKVSLKVGGKTIASGELVIINDRFGVKINDLSPSSQDASGEKPAESANEENTESGQAEEDFDYSDFEVEEEEG